MTASTQLSPEDALERAIEQAGGAAKLAEHIARVTGRSITTQAISQWRRCPPLRVAQVATAPGVKVKPKVLCPELYP